MKDYILFEKGRFKLSFAWYDIWVGAFIDTTKSKVYICLIPTFLITIKL